MGLAIGTGTDIAIESADAILMSGDLQGITNALALSKATLNNIKQNFLGIYLQHHSYSSSSRCTLFNLWDFT